MAEHAPPESKGTALIYLEPASGWVHAADRTGLERKLSGSGRTALLEHWCVDGAAQADDVLIVNQVGILDVAGRCA